MVRHLSDF